MSTYTRVHKHAVTGLDAYEEAWDYASPMFWRLLGFNLVWLFAFLAGWIGLKILLYFCNADWSTFLTFNLFFALLFLALWELANIVKFRTDQKLTVYRAAEFVLSRSVYLMLILTAYCFFILPGIYVHSRLLLHTPLCARKASTGFEAIFESWRLTSGKFVTLYALWIVTVLSKPVCALPIGLGFVLERPLSGFAKDILLSNYQRIESAALEQDRRSPGSPG